METEIPCPTVARCPSAFGRAGSGEGSALGCKTRKDSTVWKHLGLRCQLISETSTRLYYTIRLDVFPMESITYVCQVPRNMVLAENENLHALRQYLGARHTEGTSRDPDFLGCEIPIMARETFSVG